MASISPGRPSGENPPSADAAPRASGKRALKHPGDGGAPLPGNRTRRQELADRRGHVHVLESAARQSQNAAVERREAPFSSQRRKGTPSQSVPPDGLAGHPQGVSHTPAFPGAPLPSRGAKIWNSQEGLPGADQRMRAISYGWFAKRIEERAARAHSPFVPAKAGI